MAPTQHSCARARRLIISANPHQFVVKLEPAGFGRLRRVPFGDGDGKLTDNF